MPSSSKSQQRFMGMVRAAQKGELENPSKSVKKAAKSMDKDDVDDFVSNPSTHGAFLRPTNEGVINESVGTRNGTCCHDCKIEDIINDIFRGE